MGLYYLLIILFIFILFSFNLMPINHIILLLLYTIALYSVLYYVREREWTREYIIPLICFTCKKNVLFLFLSVLRTNVKITMTLYYPCYLYIIIILWLRALVPSFRPVRDACTGFPCNGFYYRERLRAVYVLL